MTFQRQLAGGDAGIVTTLWAMRAMVDDSIEVGTAVSKLAGVIASRVHFVDVDQLRAVYDFLVKHVRFQADPQGVESVRHRTG